MAAVVNQDIITATIRVKDQSRLGFNSYAREAARASKASQAFKDHAIDNIVKGLDKQLLALKLSSKQMDFHAAASAGATKEQLKAIHATHQQVDALRASQAQELAATEAKEQAKREQDRLNSSIEKTIARLNQEAKEFNMTEDQVEDYRLELMGASQAQREMVAQARAARNQVVGVGAAGKQSVKGLRLMRGGLGQVGHQVQDIAVQLQMGQNAMLVFGQQGSQIASLFGQRGALIGAVLAVGAAVGTSLAPSLFSSKSAMQELGKATEDLSKLMRIDGVTGVAQMSDELLNLSRISKDLARNKLEATLSLAMLKVEETTQSATKAMAEFSANPYDATPTMGEIGALANEFGIAFKDAESLSQAFQDVRNGTDASGDGFRSLLLDVNQLTNATEKQKKAFLAQKNVILSDLVAREMANEKIKEAKKILGDFDGELLRNNKTYRDANEEKKNFIDQLVQQGLELGKNEAAIIRQKAEALNLSDAEMQIVEALILHKQGVEELDEARKESIKTAAELLAKQNQLKESNENFVNGLGKQAAALGRTNIELIQAQINSKNLAPELRAAAQAALDFMAAFEKKQNAQAIKDGQQSQLDALVEGLRTQEEAQIESYAKTKGLIDTARLNDLDTTMDWNEIERRALEEHLKAMDAIREQAAQKEGQKISFLERATIEGEKRKKQFAMMSATEQSQHVLGELGNQFNGIAKNNKKLFAISKAFNIANAIMNTSTAATVAYKSYPPPLNYVMAGGVIAAGMGQVAQIKAQSFEGGGFTGSGSRSGGMDGKGGFAAMLHPNESVIDHTKGQQVGGVTINQTINITTGIQSTVRAEVMNLLPAISKASQNGVADARLRGGQYGRALG